METNSERILIIGCGYLGIRVAKQLREAGVCVTATTRSEERASELRALDIDVALLDVENLDAADLWTQSFDSVIYAVAAGRGSDPRIAYVDGPRGSYERLSRSTSPPARIVFVSSTGVYAQSSGEELDETSEAAPTSEPHISIRSTEEWLAEQPGGIVVRLGGLYGPGRSPIEWLTRPGFRDRLTKGRDALMNWIHIDDAAKIVTRAALVGEAGETYLGVDGRPVRREDFYGLAAELADTEPPALTDDPDDGGKRLDGSATLRKLEVFLDYPDYRAALTAIARADKDSET